jgi:hypothetical protein
MPSSCRAIKEYIAAYAIELQSMLVVDTDRDSAGGYDDEEDRKLAEWMAATADARSARINKLMAMLGISPPRNLPEPYDQERLDELDSSVFRPEGYKRRARGASEGMGLSATTTNTGVAFVLRSMIQFNHELEHISFVYDLC